VLETLDRLEAFAFQGLAQLRALVTQLDQRPGFDRSCGVCRGTKVGGLGIIDPLMRRSTAGNHLAGGQELLEALRSTIDIAMLPHVDHRGGLHGFGLVRFSMILADLHRPFLVIARYLAAYGYRFDGVLALRRVGL